MNRVPMDNARTAVNATSAALPLSATQALADATGTVSRMPVRARMLLSMLKKIRRGQLRILLPDGQWRQFGNLQAAPVTLQLRGWGALTDIMRKGDIGFAEAYRDGQVDCDDITGLLRLALQNREILESAIDGTWWGKLLYRLRHLARSNTRAGSAKNIHAHYDIGNDFYQLWLDETMTYSSAWFGTMPSQPLELAQSAKYQRILDQLQAKPGARILEIGCGWGGFAEHAARQGFHVHGVTISRAQLEFARARIERQGLQDRVTLEFCDYRDLQGQYDHVVSIEMLEAVGERFWSGYFAKVRDVLAPGGSAVIQTITIANERFGQYRTGTDFIQQYIFPGGMLPCPDRLQSLVREANMHVDDITDFGPDYAETLRRWRTAFEARLETVREQGFDEDFIRLWRFYLCYCEAAFDEKATGVVHLRLHVPEAL